MNSLNKLLTASKTPAQFLLNIDVVFLLPFVFYAALAGLFIAFIYVLLKVILQRQNIKQPHVIFEVNPLRITEQNPYTTEQLFNLFHGLAKQGSYLGKLFNVTKSYSLEIVSTKDKGIRYLIRANQEGAELIKKSLLSYLPGLKIKEVPDYFSISSKQLHQITEFKLTNHFAFPLKEHESLEKHDPIAYITGGMTKLADSELVSFQLVISPLNKRLKSDIKRISRLIYSRRDLIKNINSKSNKYLILVLLKYGAILFSQLLLLPVGLVVFAASEGKEGPLLGLSFITASKKTENPYQQELEKLIKGKLDKPLFSSSMRLLVVANNKSRIRSKRRGFVSALSSFINSSYQALIPTLKLRFKIIYSIKQLLFKHRLLKPFGNMILSTSEVGDLYHFPFTKTTKTEDLVKSHSKKLPTPISLKQSQNLDVVFAKNKYGGTTTNIGLAQDERRRHIYILGATGTGKTTILLSMIDQDIRNGKGLCVIDPHGDLIEDTLQCIPKNRIKDVVYFNPDDISYPMGINLLELSEGLNDEDALREKEYVAESIISLFHKIYSEKYSGPRMEYILRNTIHTAFTVPNATLFTVYKLLINAPFRKSVVRNLTDDDLKDFWKYEFAKAGDYQKVKMISPITNKIGRFLFSPTAKRILGQEKSTINFSEIIDDGKIFLCNLSKGKIGEDNSEVLGVVIMAKLQLAALKRARIAMKDRKDYYLYVDEFQNFATEAFAQILSEARKYRLNAILAHQTTSQIKDKSLVNITLANTGTVICFRTANPEDEKLILPQFRPFIDQGEIASLPSYHFYMRLGALNPEEPFSGETVLTKIISSKQAVFEIVQSSREQFAIKYVQSKEISKRTSKKVLKKQRSRPATILPYG